MWNFESLLVSTEGKGKGRREREGRTGREGESERL